MVASRVLAAVLLLTGPALAQQVVPRHGTIHATAAAGQEKRIFNYASWGPDCTPLPVPVVAVVQPPGHGGIAVRPGQSTVSVMRQGAADCTGRTYPAATVWFTPDAGFRGTDRFTLAVTTTRGTAEDTVVVEVR